MSRPSRANIKAMREHLGDSTWPDVTPAQIERMPARQIEGAIDRHYAGGVTQFLKDGAER